MNDPRHKTSVMRTLGLTLGDLWSVLKSGKPKQTTRQSVRQRVEEETHQTDQGKVTLRRTVIEEVEIRPEPRRDEGPAA